MIYCISNYKGGVSKTRLTSDSYKMNTRRGRNEGFSKSTIFSHGLGSKYWRGVKK